jgi:phosphinothricin acetyltransferase
MPPLIRLATEHDAEPMLAIYAPFCTTSAVSFEEEPPSPEEMRRRARSILARFPWLVCEDDGEVLGYVYGCPHRERSAYRWSVEVAAYVKEGQRRRGIGRALYVSLLKLLALQGFYNAYAGITLPNPASVALHEAVGFRAVGVYQGVGHKFGAWRDVGWWYRDLRPREGPPEPPRDLPAIQGAPGWEEGLSAGLALLR